jgi:hypothetical protein
MSNLLIKDKPLLVLPVLACECGLNEAIFLQQLHYWLERSENMRDGHKWVYNSYEDWRKQFPFWSVSTMKRIIWKLEKEGYIISSNYNRLKIDHTKWYRINYDALAHLSGSSIQSEPRDYSEWTKMQSSVNRPIPESTTENTTKNTAKLAENHAASHTFKLDKEQVIKDEILRALPNSDVKIIANRFIELRKSGRPLRQSDYNGIKQVLDAGATCDNALKWLEECFQKYKPKHDYDKIHSFLYCVPYILDRQGEYARVEMAKKVLAMSDEELDNFDYSQLPRMYNPDDFDLDD